MKIIGLEKLSVATGWPLPLLGRLWRHRRIPGSKPGYRTIVFDLQRVHDALERMERKVR